MEEIYLIEDTRQQQGKHLFKDSYFKFNNIKVLKSKLPFGDYSLYGDMSLVIDTKKDIMEVAQCLMQGHERFRKEIVGANNFNTGIIILIEENVKYTFKTLISDYKIPCYKTKGFKKANGKSIMTHYQGQPMARFNIESVVKTMLTMQEKYGVLFMFTTKEKCGEDIINILSKDRITYKKYFEKKLNEIKERGIKNE